MRAFCFPFGGPGQSRPGICGDFDLSREVSLTPGFHSLMFIAQADGVAVVTPEPTTLLLFGATAAGLGLPRSAAARREQQHPGRSLREIERAPLVGSRSLGRWPGGAGTLGWNESTALGEGKLS